MRASTANSSAKASTTSHPVTDHGAIERWRREQSLRRTLERRRDLFLKHELTPDDLKLLGLVPPKKKRERRRPAPPEAGKPTSDE